MPALDLDDRSKPQDDAYVLASSIHAGFGLHDVVQPLWAAADEDEDAEAEDDDLDDEDDLDDDDLDDDELDDDDLDDEDDDLDDEDDDLAEEEELEASAGAFGPGASRPSIEPRSFADSASQESLRLDEGLEETFPASDPVSAKHIS